jgi:hypothetical protein
MMVARVSMHRDHREAATDGRLIHGFREDDRLCDERSRNRRQNPWSRMPDMTAFTGETIRRRDAAMMGRREGL